MPHPGKSWLGKCPEDMGTFGVDWAIMKFIAMDNIHRRFKVGSWKDLNVLLGKKRHKISGLSWIQGFKI